MRTKSRLLDALMPRTRQAILGATLLRPDHAWYAGELARHLGMPRSSLQRELSAMLAVGILKGRRKGRMLFIQANNESPVYADLRGLLSKTTGLVDLIRDALSRSQERIKISFVFGSIARAEETAVSDIDLLIVGEAGLQEVAPLLHDCQEKLGREINPRCFRSDEFARRIASKDHFVLSVLSKPKIFIAGSQNELDRFVERKSRGAAPHRPG